MKLSEKTDNQYITFITIMRDMINIRDMTDSTALTYDRQER